MKTINRVKLVKKLAYGKLRQRQSRASYLNFVKESNRNLLQSELRNSAGQNNLH